MTWHEWWRLKSGYERGIVINKLPLSSQALLSLTKSTQCGMGLTCKLQKTKIDHESIQCKWRNKDYKESNRTKKHTIDSSMSPVGPPPLFSCLVHLNVRNEKGINIQTFDLIIKWFTIQVLVTDQNHKRLKNHSSQKPTSALLSAFLRRSRTNWADLAGQRPWPFECLFFAWAVRPTPRQKRVNGIACLWAITSSKYLLALFNGSFLMACAVSLVFYSEQNKFKNNY